MEPEREALRLSAMIALCVGAYIIMLSIDNFQQQQVPGQIGDAQCTWWSASVKGCETSNGSLGDITAPKRAIAFNM